MIIFINIISVFEINIFNNLNQLKGNQKGI